MADFNFEDVLAAINGQPDAAPEAEPGAVDSSQWTDVVQDPASQWDEFVPQQEHIEITPEEAGVPPGQDVDFVLNPEDPDVNRPYPGMAPQGSGGVKSAGVGYSRSQSHSGIAGGPATVKGLYDDAHARTEADQAKAAAGYDQERQAYREDYADLARVTAEQGELEREHHDRMLDQLDRQRDFLDLHARLEQKLAAEAKAESHKYLAAYQDQLSAVRVLAAQDANPLHRGNTALGLAGAAFLQGYLGARGVQVDVTGQVDRWVDRELQQHQQRVQNARASANDALHLYDIARQSAQDDAEARQRYKGMVLEGMKVGVEMEAEKFGSDVARSRARAAVANLQLQQDQVMFGIREKQERRNYEIGKMHLDAAKDQGHLMMEEESAAETRRHNINMEGIARKAAKKDEKPDIKPTVSDPGLPVKDGAGKVVGNRTMWRRAPGTTDAQFNAASKTADEYGAEYRQVMKGVAKLRQLRAPAMDDFVNKWGPEFASKRFDEAKRAYEREVLHTLQQVRHSIAGAQLTPFERDEWLELVPIDKGAEAGTNASALEQLEGRFRDRFVSFMDSSGAYELLPESERGTRLTNEETNATDSRYGASLHGGPPVITSVDKEEAEAKHGHTDRKPAHAAWFKFQGGDRPDATLFKKEEFETMPEWAISMDHLAKVVVDSEFRTRAAQIPDSTNDTSTPAPPPSTLYKDAFQAIGRLASDEKLPGNRREYAKYLFDRMDNDPEGLLADYGDQLTEDTKPLTGHLRR